MSDLTDSPTPAKQQKLLSSVTEVSSEIDSSYVDIETQKALEDIDSCQSDLEALNVKASEEILLVEMKFNKLRRPHFVKRNDLIRHIPNFWVTAFLNHPRMANIVEEEEEECLHYLKQIDFEELPDIKSGYTMRFLFETNPYFSNEVLVKEFYLDPTDISKPTSEPPKINWKPNMDLTKLKNRKHPRSVGRSFFSWLTDNIDPWKDRIAEIIKDDLWQNPLQYYLASDIEVEENGVTDSDDDDHQIIEDDSIVIVGDDDDDEPGDDDDVYEVKDDEDDLESHEEFEETVESIEVEDDDDDDDDDDAIEVLGSDSEAELLQEQSKMSELDTSLVTDSESGAKYDKSSDNVVSDEVISSQSGENDAADSEILNADGDAEMENNDGNDSDLLKDDDDDNDGGDDDDNKMEKVVPDSSVLKDSEQKVKDGVEKAVDGVD